MAAPRERSGQLPLYRRRLRLQARGRGSDPDVRRRGRCLPHQRPLQDRCRRTAQAKRLSTAFDSVDALRLRSRRAAGHLRQGRQFRRVDRHPRRHQGALRRLRSVRSDHLGVDDDQRPGAVDPGDVLQRRDRSADSQRFTAENERRPTEEEAEKIARMGAGERPRHGAGGHPQGRPGAEHLHLLHRVRAAG